MPTLDTHFIKSRRLALSHVTPLFPLFFLYFFFFVQLCRDKNLRFLRLFAPKVNAGPDHPQTSGRPFRVRSTLPSLSLGAPSTFANRHCFHVVATAVRGYCVVRYARDTSPEWKSRKSQPRGFRPLLICSPRFRHRGFAEETRKRRRRARNSPVGIRVARLGEVR